ncbi:unnamed protein product [Tuber melanosporum]|uniref:(Perigord truffle) hypothetical protein n=1 Tax=Tuber melanosporum (strain Mel28) TaxID=656061 RepID=D5GCC5_TUBMM|nr:uncharacterized protein GSTUM_00005818001 [Tuber melanosporum]CAZ82168.1 unnamed protein product [Tuber melanosporum]
MKTSFSALAALAAALLLSSANAHVNLKSPVPFRTSTQAPQNAIQQDFDMKAPLDKSGSNFPCKGYHKDAKGTQPLVDWPAGSTQTMSFDGSATHGGGSCQVSFSEDGGNTWKVGKSFVGGCPLKDISFTVPKETKNGPVFVAWTWFNNVGNREMYMNCAAITNTGGGQGLSAYPDMFKANIGNDCTTETGDLAFPDPGKNVEGSGGVPPVGGGCGATGSQPPAGGSHPNPTLSSAPPQLTPTSGSQVTSPAPSGTTKTSVPAGTPSSVPSGTVAPVPSSPAPAPSTAPSQYPQPSTGGACVEGAITCNADGTWSQCGSGVNQNMGKTAPGTACANGGTKPIKTKRFIRFSKEHMARNA